MEIGADESRFQGEWKDGVKSGHGTYISAIGRKYVGDWKNDKQDGEGLMTWPSGQRFLGKFKDGMRNGKGQMIWPSGEKYDGEWKDDKQDGQGIFYYSNKQVYNGEWSGNQVNGIGTMSYPNGKRSSGEWRDGTLVKEGATTKEKEVAVKEKNQPKEKPVVAATPVQEKPIVVNTPPKEKPPGTTNNSTTANTNTSTKKHNTPVSETKQEEVQNIPKPKSPAVLEIVNAQFVDNSGDKDNVLSIHGTGEITFILSNQGLGDAYNMVIAIKDVNDIKGVEYSPKFTISHLAAGGQTTVKIPVKGSADMDTGATNFNIKISEANGSDADPFYVNFRTLGKNPPQDN